MQKPTFEIEKVTFESEKWKEEFDKKFPNPEKWNEIWLISQEGDKVKNFISNLLDQQKKDLINQILKEAPKDRDVMLKDSMTRILPNLQNTGFNKCNQLWEDNLTKLIK